MPTPNTRGFCHKFASRATRERGWSKGRLFFEPGRENFSFLRVREYSCSSAGLKKKLTFFFFAPSACREEQQKQTLKTESHCLACSTLLIPSSLLYKKPPGSFMYNYFTVQVLLYFLGGPQLPSNVSLDLDSGSTSCSYSIST